MARFRNQSIPRAVSKRQTLWGLSVISGGFTGIAANSKLLFASASSAGLAPQLPQTLIRIRGMMNVVSDQVVATEFPSGAFGIAVVNETARALGITALPGPISDPLFPWVVHQFFDQEFQFISATGVQSPADREYVIDSKSMRKLKDEQAIIFMFELGSGVGANVAFQGRLLMKAG